jgi:hypothetical protein
MFSPSYKGELWSRPVPSKSTRPYLKNKLKQKGRGMALSLKFYYCPKKRGKEGRGMKEGRKEKKKRKGKNRNFTNGTQKSYHPVVLWITIMTCKNPKYSRPNKYSLNKVCQEE